MADFVIRQWDLAPYPGDQAPPHVHYLGLRFTDPPTSARLQPGGGPGQATHKISLRSVPEVDAEVVGLLRAAHEQNG